MIATGSGTKEPVKLSATAERFCRRFSLAEILLATQDFNEGNLIGIGGFGKVYKGHIDDGKETVAMKRLAQNSNQGEGEFLTEIETLSKLRHVNLVSLIGYCDENGEMILVYEYIARGTLADYRSTLTWKQRLNLCIGAGRGLDYLHTGWDNSIIHRDVKSTNILLDENFTAKVSDFGLAKHLSSNDSKCHVSTLVKGSFGYLDPSYLTTGRLTMKSDTYAFGVVLLEVLTARPAVDPRLADYGGSMVMWAQEKIKKGKLDQIIASNLRDEISEDCLRTFVGVAKRCLHHDPHKRPSMGEAVTGLQLASKQQDKKAPTHKPSRFLPYFFLARPTTSRQATGSAQKVHERADVNTLSTTIPAIDEETVKEELTFNMLPLAVPAVSIDESEDQLTGDVPAILINRLEDIQCVTISPVEIDESEDQFSVEVAPIAVPAISINRLEDIQNVTISPAAIDESEDQSTLDASPNAITAIPIHELKDITNNFSSECVIGKKKRKSLYRGALKCGQVAAIKKVRYSSSNWTCGEFVKQVSMVSNLRHENVAQLLGYCVDGPHQLLAYEFAPNGSLHDILHGVNGSKPVWALSWGQRVKIAMGVAKGLEHVHKKAQIHYNIKSSNILLFDDCHVAKLVDFGLPIQSTRVIWNLLPDYDPPGWPCEVSWRTDVYSFGVVLVELLTGCKVIDYTRPTGEHHLVEWALPKLNKYKVKEIVDPRLNGHYPPMAVEKMAKIAAACLQLVAEFRPVMSLVVSDLYPLLDDMETQNLKKL